MNKRTKRISSIIVSVLVVVILTAGSFAYLKRHDISRELERATLPTALPYKSDPLTSRPALPVADSVPSTSTSPSSSPTASLPAQANLAIPFTVQAPRANWDDPYGEFCEEASVLMAVSYVRHQDIPSADYADQELLKIKTFEEKRFGYYKDTTIAEVATIFKEYYDYPHVRVVANPTVQDIKEAVASGQTVLMPAAGRQLGNPYFQTPGPIYHMLVIKGYTTGGQFIVNDPGTRRGADFLYKENVLMNAMHDWRGDGQIELGRKAILIVG
jgi:hypothetical protein